MLDEIPLAALMMKKLLDAERLVVLLFLDEMLLGELLKDEHSMQMIPMAALDAGMLHSLH